MRRQICRLRLVERRRKRSNAVERSVQAELMDEWVYKDAVANTGAMSESLL